MVEKKMKNFIFCSIFGDSGAEKREQRYTEQVPERAAAAPYRQASAFYVIMKDWNHPPV